MIFRAVFFIGLVSLLTPREPDLGFGRPGAGTWLPSPATVLSAAGLSQMGQVCSACAGRLGAFSDLPAAPPANASFHLRSLADIKAVLEASIKQRNARNI